MLLTHNNAVCKAHNSSNNENLDKKYLTNRRYPMYPFFTLLFVVDLFQVKLCDSLDKEVERGGVLSLSYPQAGWNRFIQGQIFFFLVNPLF